MKILTFLLIFTFGTIAQSLKGTNNEGVDKYEQGKYDDAIGLFKKGTELDNKAAVPDFNLGAGYYKKGNYKESIDAFQNSLGKSSDPEFQSKAWYNIGNAQLKAGDLKAAVEAYKNALKLDPNDPDAKYNLSYTLKKLKQKEEEEKKKKEEEKKKDKKDDKEKKQDQPKKDEKKDDKKDQQNKPDDNQNKNKKDNKQQEPPQGNPKQDKKLNKEDAEKILNALKDKEKDLRKNKKNQQLRGFGREKDW